MRSNRDHERFEYKSSIGRRGDVESKENKSSESTHEDDKLYPSSFFCPISLQLYKNPVITDDGHTYESDSIRTHFRVSRTRKSPNTGLDLSSITLRQNHQLRSAMDEFKEKILPQLKKVYNLEQELKNTREELAKTKAELNGMRGSGASGVSITSALKQDLITKLSRVIDEALPTPAVASVGEVSVEQKREQKENKSSVTSQAGLSILADVCVDAATRTNDVKPASESKVNEAPELPSESEFLELDDLDSLLLTAVSIGDVDEVKSLLEKGADVNATISENDQNALMLALDLRRDDPAAAKKMIELLVEMKANLNHVDFDGNTPMHYAAANNDEWGVSFLVNKNANANAMNVAGLTPYRLCIQKNPGSYNERIIRKLFEVTRSGSEHRLFDTLFRPHRSVQLVSHQEQKNEPAPASRPPRAAESKAVSLSVDEKDILPIDRVVTLPHRPIHRR